MYRKLEIYNHEKTYLFPNMCVATPEEVAKNYSAVNIPSLTTVIETDESGIMFYTAPEPISVLKSRHGVNQSLSDEEAIAAIEEILNAPQPDPEPTAEERIAAALEFQNLLSM